MKVLRFFFCLLLAGCATTQGIDQRLTVNPAGQTTFYRDQYVTKSAVEVYIEPADRALYAPTALFFPFRVTQEMDDPGIAGYSVARTIWQTWTTMRLFPVMEFSGDNNPFSRNRAVALGKQRGVDIVIGGFVTYFYAGGTAGDSQVAIQIEAIDVRTGQTIWSMSQGAMVPATSKQDYFLFAVRHRMPSDPVMACVKAIAIDTGKRVQNWMSGSAPVESLERLDQKVHDTLFPPTNTVPSPRPMDSDDESLSSI